jgi:hypothetical protein
MSLTKEFFLYRDEDESPTPEPKTTETVVEVGDSVTLNASYNVGTGEWRYADDRSRKEPARSVDSPYLTVEEAAAYCRCKPKTILNHKSLGNVSSVSGPRPLLFRREDLDRWLTSRGKSRKK